MQEEDMKEKKQLHEGAKRDTGSTGGKRELLGVRKEAIFGGR